MVLYSHSKKKKLKHRGISSPTIRVRTRILIKLKSTLVYILSLELNSLPCTSCAEFASQHWGCRGIIGVLSFICNVNLHILSYILEGNELFSIWNSQWRITFFFISDFNLNFTIISKTVRIEIVLDAFWFTAEKVYSNYGLSFWSTDLIWISCGLFWVYSTLSIVCIWSNYFPYPPNSASSFFKS